MVAVDSNFFVLVKNPPVADKLIDDIGEEAFFEMLKAYSKSGVFDNEVKGLTFRLSVGYS